MKENQDYLCGRKPVEEALKGDVPLKKVYLSRKSPFSERIAALCRAKKVSFIYLEKRELDSHHGPGDAEKRKVHR